MKKIAVLSPPPPARPSSTTAARPAPPSADAREARDYGRVAWRQPAPYYGYGYRGYRDDGYRPYDPYSY